MFSTRLRATLKSGEFKRQDQLIERLLEEGFASTDIASALIHQLQGGGIPPANPAPRPAEQPRPERPAQPRPPVAAVYDRRTIPPHLQPRRTPPASAPRPASPSHPQHRPLPAAPVPAPKPASLARPNPDLNLNPNLNPPPKPAPKPARPFANPQLAAPACRAVASAKAGAPGEGGSAIRNLPRPSQAKAGPQPIAPRPSFQPKTKSVAHPFQTRLWINVGAEAGIAPIDIVNTIAGETGLPGNVVGTVNIHPRHLFVDVAAEHANAIISKLNRTQIKGHKLKVKAA